MPADEMFVQQVLDRFQLIGQVTARKMFGGHGIFKDGLMIALIADNELYLKADKQSAHLFTKNNLQPFSYNKAGKIMQMSYYQAPESFFEDDEETRRWAKYAVEAALRAPRKSGKK